MGAHRLLVQLCKELVLSDWPSGEHGVVGIILRWVTELGRLLNPLQKGSLGVLCALVIAWFLFWEESLSSSSLLLKTIRIFFI